MSIYIGPLEKIGYGQLRGFQEGKYKGNEIEVAEYFSEPGDTYESFYAAMGWLHENGYQFGSIDHPKKYIAITKGDYNLPQKWHNISQKQKDKLVGFLFSNSFREQPVAVYIFKAQ